MTDQLGEFIADTMFTVGGTAQFEGPYYRDDDVTVYQGDCLNVLRLLAPNSVDAVVTDPPYGLGFMGQEWDSSAALASRPPSADPIDARYRNVFPRTGKGPAATAFDGKAFQLWCQTWAAECLRVLKPGGHMLAFGGTRTAHRLAVAIEDAGAEIRDSVIWIYGSGFPKSLDVSKAIDKAAGVEREVVGPLQSVPNHNLPGTGARFRNVAELSGERIDVPLSSAPATDAAKQWAGWGTALKPSMEIICVARKPLQGTVAANVQKWGTGALNIAATRVQPRGAGENISGDNTACTCLSRAADQTNHTPNTPQDLWSDASPADRNGPPASAHAHDCDCPRPQDSQDDCQTSPCSCGEHAHSTTAADPTSVQPQHDAQKCHARCATTEHSQNAYQSTAYTDYTVGDVESTAGRWPPNVVLDGDTADMLDKQSGTLHTHPGTLGKDAPAGLGFIPTSKAGTVIKADSGGASRFFPTFRYTAKAATTERPTADGVNHPTVKPLSLMRWLVKLVTPPGGTVLDPFAGSGTTGEAAIHEHKHAILIEREPTYLPLIVARLHKPMQTGFNFDTDEDTPF